MLHHDRIAMSEVTDINKTSASKECDIYHYQMSVMGAMIY